MICWLKYILLLSRFRIHQEIIAFSMATFTQNGSFFDVRGLVFRDAVMEEEKSFLLRDLVNQLSLVCQKNNLNESSSIYLHLVSSARHFVIRLLENRLFLFYQMTWKLHQQSLQTIRTFDQQEALINDCLRILAESPFWLNTLKLQIFWSEKYRTKGG